MIGGAVVSILLLAPSGQPSNALAFTSDLTIDRSVVRLADIIDTSRLPQALQTRARMLDLVSVPAGQDHLVLSARWVSERARALLPALNPWLPANPAGQVTIRRVAAPVEPGLGPSSNLCLRVVQPLERGQFLSAGDFEPAPCTRDAGILPSAYRSDLKAGQATRALAKGETFRSLPGLALLQIKPGQSLEVETRVGPVTVQRAVTALQPAAPGQSLFVRTADGAVLSVSVPAQARP